jgi:hypothetical protein
MKFLTIISAFLYLSSEILTRRTRSHHKTHICENGTKQKNEACTWKMCGSECAAGLACQRKDESRDTVCKVQFLSACSNNSDCGYDAFCDTDSKCHYLPYGMTQKDLEPKKKSGNRRRRKY